MWKNYGEGSLENKKLCGEPATLDESEMARIRWASSPTKSDRILNA